MIYITKKLGLYPLWTIVLYGGLLVYIQSILCVNSFVCFLLRMHLMKKETKVRLSNSTKSLGCLLFSTLTIQSVTTKV